MTGLTTSSRARVRVEIEISITPRNNWGATATVDQIHKQAVASALGKLKMGLETRAWRVIGEPEVTMILVDAK